MYRRHFHLKERPFQLVPTPSYLFPSRCHQEALGHLTYALETGEGFVEVTGEVGTGKTTLLRTFLEGLDETVSVACIFNPTLNAVELLQSINRDFGIDAGSSSRSDLTAALQRFLIENREMGKKALLVIDEAQNLSIEVLEELRLLSNLETTRAKLLQTVLCGQPELGEMLERHELRQLAQRISLACRLQPLSSEETHDYIVHRLKRASLGARGDLFTPRARAQVYRYSGGTPRVINICCDRALLCGYVAGKDRVDAGAVKKAVAELADRPYMDRTLLGRPLPAWGVAVLGVAIVFMAGFLVFGTSLWHPEATQTAPVAVTDGQGNAASPATYGLFDLFDEAGVAESVPWGVRRIMGAWGHTLSASELPAIGDPYLLLSAVAAPLGMEVMPMDGDLDRAMAFGLPVLMLFGSDGQGPLALVFEGEEAGGLLRFQSPKGIVELSRGDADRLWSGRALIACTNPLGFSEVVTERSGLQEVIALESALSRAGFHGVSVDGRFDGETLRAVHALQEAYGILSDGMVGDLTRVALAAALKNGLPDTPERVAAHDRQKGEIP